MVQEAGRNGFKVVIDCDDAALDLKKVVYDHIRAKGMDITDLDFSSSNVGAIYPEIGYNLALKIQDGSYDRGILLCGTGLGMAIVANKVQGVYAGVCHDVYSAERLRKSNNAQVLTMGARVIGPELAKTIVDAWLASEFVGESSLPKVEKIHEIENISFHKVVKPEQ